MQTPQPDAHAQGGRCRLCSANDVDALVEELAAELWKYQSVGTLDESPWDQASEYWRHVFRQFAATAVKTMQARH
ncbi:hypothetical protein [Sphingomonas immobilis]|uniref:hypothetical protein n=1 Tax=Sphingomonas immobilis TaxID=3063997 RepID=UPI00272C5AF0|nr:hypothetical protein [Sphingomonas sp. CA1-15]